MLRYIICANLRNLPACASQWQAGLMMGLVMGDSVATSSNSQYSIVNIQFLWCAHGFYGRTGMPAVWGAR